MKPVLAIDLDDTIRPWTFPLREWVACELGLAPGSGKYHDKVLLCDVFDIPRAQGDEFANRFAEHDFGRDIPPFSGISETLHQLATENRLYIVTARLEMARSVTEEYVERYFPALFEEVIFCNYQLDSREPKHAVCRRVGADVIIDDRLHNIREYTSNGLRAILFGSYPWNASDELPANTLRASNCQEIPALLSRLRRSR